MVIRHLFTPSFRNRLRLFFVVIVIIPMVAVAFVLFQLVSRSEQSQVDAQLAEAQIVAQHLYRASAAEASDAGRAIASDRQLGKAIAGKDATAIQARLDQVSRRVGARRVLLDLTGPGRFEYGTEVGIAPSRNALRDQNNRPLGRLTTSVDSVQSFATKIDDTTEMGVAIDENGKVTGVSRPNLAHGDLPDDGAVDLDGTQYRVRSVGVRGFGGQPLTMRLVTPDNKNTSNPALIVLGALLGFVVLAIAFAITVSRTLHDEVQGLLAAARAIGRGDFSQRVPTEGNDEFAALGREFNAMAEELEGRLEDLRRERARLAEAIRRVGESFTKSLDRVGLLEIVVQTATDGVEAACGRATIRLAGDDRLQEVAATGDPNSYSRALHAAEAAALDAGQIAEVELGGASALAAPLGGDGAVGIVSVARGDIGRASCRER